MKSHMKYYTQLANHKVAKMVHTESIGNVFGLAVMCATAGGLGAYVLGEGIENDADHLRADNAEYVAMQLDARLADLSEKKEMLKNMTAEIAQTSRAGGDSSTLDQIRLQKVDEFSTDARQVVMDAFLSTELSEQERQDFITHIDEKLVDMGDIGLDVLESRDHVVDFGNVREGRLQIDAAHPLLNNEERVEAIAAFNNKKDINMFFIVLMGMMVSGFMGTCGVFDAYANKKDLACNPPKKPQKNRPQGIKH